MRVQLVDAILSLHAEQLVSHVSLQYAHFVECSLDLIASIVAPLNVNHQDQLVRFRRQVNILARLELRPGRGLNLPF